VVENIFWISSYLATDTGGTFIELNLKIFQYINKKPANNTDPKNRLSSHNEVALGLKLSTNLPFVVENILCWTSHIHSGGGGCEIEMKLHKTLNTQNNISS
jgi:hypothetical protein